MTQHSAQTIVDHVWRTVGAASFRDLGDDALLRETTRGRERESQAAFAVLVQRHGPLVYRTCCAVLRNAHDAEDAFQATFLVLTRKAPSLRSQRCVGPWLYEVARRVSLHARAAAEHRQRHERQAAVPETESVAPERREELSLLHDALQQLPSRWRIPIVLCDLEGLSYQEAAGQLGWSVPTFRNRLARGRQRLQTSLRRRGIEPAAAIGAYAAIPTVPQTLLKTTAVQSILGAGVAGAIPASILALTNSGLQTMLLIKLQSAGLAFVATSVLIAGAIGLSGQTPTSKPKGDDAEKPATKAAEKPESNVAVSAKTAALVAKLSGSASIDKPIEDTSLRDVLEYLSEKFGVTFVIDRQGFERIGKQNVEEERIRLAKMPNVSLDTVLRQVLAQVQGAFMVREDHIEVTSFDAAVMESRNGVGLAREFSTEVQPLVSVVCADQPIGNVLAEFSRQSRRNVVLDSRIPDRARLNVSVTLLNTPLDTATRIVAELVNLKTVSMDNVIFVTSREHAAELENEKDAAAERRRSANPDMAKPAKTDQSKQ